MEKRKKCTNCGKSKKLSEFSPRKDSKDGFRNECRECRNSRQRVYQSAKAGKKRVADAKKSIEKAINECKTGCMGGGMKTVMEVSCLIESVVQTIAGNFGMEASVLVKLKPKNAKKCSR